MTDKKIKSLSSKQSLMLTRDQHLGKLPPQALDLEEVVLGSIMLNKNALIEVISILKPESFYKDTHQRIYKAMIALFDQTDPVDILTVTQELRSKGELEMCGGAYYISQLTRRIGSTENIEFHARIIAENSMKRNLISMSSDTMNKSYEDTVDVFDILDGVEKTLYEISNDLVKKEAQFMYDLVPQSIDELQAKQKNSELKGVPSGIKALDEVTGGWQNSDMIIIAGRPGMGKTAFIITTALNATLEHKKSIGIFTLEMSAKQLTDRMVSSVAEVNGEAIRKATVNSEEWQRIYRKTQPLKQAKIMVDDTPSISIREFRSKAIRWKKQHHIDMIVVDYLQLMTAPEYGTFREQEIASISRTLKKVAKELDIPVIALAQLSRDVEKRGGAKRPQLSDLRESGSIEQDADVVMFLYRPEYYGFTDIEDESGETVSSNSLAQAIIAKNRHGSVRDVPMKFIKNYAKFTDYKKESADFTEDETVPEFIDPENDTESPFYKPKKVNK